MHRKSGHRGTQVGWHIAKDAGLPLKYSDLVTVAMAWPVCSKQHPRQSLECSPGEGLTSDNAGHLPLSQVKVLNGPGLCGHYAWLDQAFPCHLMRQGATLRGLEKLSTMYRCPHQVHSDRGHISKPMMCRTGQKNRTLSGGSISL